MPAQTVIKLRRSTTSQWETTNPVLASGEPGFDTTLNKMKVGNGSSTWTALGYASGGGGITVSENPPTSPELGDLWFNSSNAITYIYYDSFWVDLVPTLAGPTGPTGPEGPEGPEGPAGNTDELFVLILMGAV
jgi:hypothetical protein